jgi:hypothetical protein
VGIFGATEVTTLPVAGSTPTVGTAAAELTPRLPISVDPSGIPVPAPLPIVVGEVDVGVDDEALLPEPHIPDIPDDIDIPEVAAMAGVAVPMAIPPPS